MKIRFLIFLTALIFIVPLTACANGAVELPPPDNSGEIKILTVWTLWSNNDNAHAKSFYMALEGFKDENPDIIIKHDTTENEAYKTKIKTAIAVGEAPDVFFAWGGGFVQPFVADGALLQLDDYLDENTKGRILGKALDNFTYDGKIYGLTFAKWVGVLYCNEEMFGKAGIKIPETHDELMAAVEGFKARGIVPLACGAKDGWPAMFYQNVAALRTAGADVVNETLAGNATFETPEMLESVKLVDELVKAGAFGTGALALTNDEAKLAFLRGDVPMIYQGSWFAGEIRDPSRSLVVNKVVAKNWPSVFGGADPSQILGGAIDGLCISSNASDPEIAYKFISYVTENMSRECFRLGGGINTWELDTSGMEIDPLVEQIQDMAERASGSTLAWDTILKVEAARRHLSLCQEIFASQIEPEAFVAEMQKLQ